MITGFNTDVNFEGITYHVQTEDKGLDTPLILSLVYQHGTILASKRSKYDDLVEKGFDEKVLAERLKRQHALMCAAVKSGRIEDLKRMTLSRAKRKVDVKTDSNLPFVDSLARTDSNVVHGNIDTEIEKTVDESISNSEPFLEESQQPLLVTEIIETSIANNDSEKFETVWDIPLVEDVTIIESDEFFEEGFVLSPDAISIVEEANFSAHPLRDELKIKFLADYTFRAGDKKNVNLIVCRGEDEREVEGAQVMVKVLGSDFRPLIFHAKTDSHGVATVFVKLPMFRTGRAALLVRASVGGEETEQRRVIFHQ
ncbi:MAG: hypothetical protein ACK5NT_14835 [Pyrinomonadaceae bacterium]